jgi:hypothetical protein
VLPLTESATGNLGGDTASSVDATSDKHPLDIDAPGEFLFGPDILVAPPSYPDELKQLLCAVAAGHLVRLLDGREASTAAQADQP